MFDEKHSMTWIQEIDKNILFPKFFQWIKASNRFVDEKHSITWNISKLNGQEYYNFLISYYVPSVRESNWFVDGKGFHCLKSVNW